MVNILAHKNVYFNPPRFLKSLNFQTNDGASASSEGVLALCAPHLHPAAVLVFQLLQEVVLHLQLSALVLHVRLQGRASHDPLTVGGGNRIHLPTCHGAAISKECEDVSLHVGGKKKSGYKLCRLHQNFVMLCDVVEKAIQIKYVILSKCGMLFSKNAAAESQDALISLRKNPTCRISCMLWRWSWFPGDLYLFVWTGVSVTAYVWYAM